MRIPRYIGYPVIFAAGYGALYWWANRAIYFPFRFPEGDWGVQHILGAQDVFLVAADGVRLHGWWIPRSGSRIATLFLHGNAGNITHRARSVRALTAAGSSVLLIDYRGYGKSEGRPSERGLYADAMAAYAHLRDRGYAARDIVVHGESLGTAVAVDLASKVDCGGVILEAPFSSAKDVARRVAPGLGPMLIHSYDSKSKIGRLRASLLVIHGTKDEVIPFALGKALFDAANPPKQFWEVPGAGHNDLVEAGGPGYVEQVRAFLMRVSASGAH